MYSRLIVQSFDFILTFNEKFFNISVQECAMIKQGPFCLTILHFLYLRSWELVPSHYIVESWLSHVRELCEDPIYTLVDIHYVLVHDSLSELKHVVLQRVWVYSKLILVAVLNECTRSREVESFVAIVKEPVVSRSNSMSELANLSKVIGDLRVIPEHQVD